MCSKCHSAQYCSRMHQKIHWSSHKVSCGTGHTSPAPDTTNSLFPEYSIVIEDEVLDDEVVQPLNTAADSATDDAPDGDFDEQLTVPTNDPAYIHFLTRVSRGGNDQVLRYVCHRRGCLPLQISATPPITPSACLHCGAPSVLEFQVLHVDNNSSPSNEDCADNATDATLLTSGCKHQNSCHSCRRRTEELAQECLSQ